MGGEPHGEADAAMNAIVVRESKIHRDGLFGALIAAFAVAFARGYTGAQTASGRIAVAVFVGVVTALLVWGWVLSIRRPCHLEISGNAITLVSVRRPPITLSREWGDELAVVSAGSGRFAYRGLIIRGASPVIPLRLFSLRQIRPPCVARGWRFERAQRTTRRATPGTRA